MNPRLVLSLWRERWGKAADSTNTHPYLQGRPNQWGRKLTNASAWYIPGVTALGLVGGLFVFITLTTAQFSLGGQVAFSVLFVSAALYARRYAGTLLTLVLCVMWAIVSTRYLYWRLAETLASELNLSFVLGFGLWAAELYLWAVIALRITQSVWPLTRASVRLPKDSTVWPAVDVFIHAQGKTDAAIKQATLAALAMHWPTTKIKVTILDTLPRDGVQTIADALGAGYLASHDAADSQAALVNRALTVTQGALILILDGAQVPDKSFLQSTVGWFVQDQRLGMLQTPHHFLAPAPSAHSLALCQSPTLPGGVACAMLRRTMLVAAGGIEPGAVTGRTHTALSLQIQGYVHGYFGYGGGAVEGIAQNSALTQAQLGLERPASSESALFRVDDPFLGRALTWKQHLAALQSVSQFYCALPRLIFLIAPLAFLLVGVPLIQTTPELLVAYALPYGLLAYFTQARLQGASRLPIGTEIRETALAWYLLIPTTWTLVRTALRRGRGVFQRATPVPFDRWIVGFYGVFVLVSCVGFGMGVARLPFLQGQALAITTLYLLWCACNLMLLAASLAIAKEARQVRQQTRQLQQMPAMVQLPSGRTMVCMTQNFPQTHLSLQLPAPLAVETGSMVNLSIFRGHREFTFPACVVSQHNNVLAVSVENTIQNNYHLFGAAVLSRGPDWPLWLPARDADRPLPLWLTRFLSRAWAKWVAIAWNPGAFKSWPRLGRWMRK